MKPGLNLPGGLPIINEVLFLAHKGNDIAFGLAAEAMIPAAIWRRVKRRRVLFMEGA
jgi:hypothetical protein